MRFTMQFKQNVGVFTANGGQVGHIDRVVVDPQTKAVTHIVVRKGFLFTEDKVVPFDLIAEANEDRIMLRDDAGDLQSLPPFEEKHYILSGDKTGGTTSPSGYAPAVYGYTPFGGPGDYGAPSDQRHIAQIEQNIPEGTVALKEGAKVITAEGKYAGRVERVFTDAQAKRATHLLIAQGLLLKERKLIPITWVQVVGNNEVYLSVKQRVLERLTAFHIERRTS